MDGATHTLTSGFLVGGGRFTLVKQLGSGGMSVIWLAHDERLNESVALKFLPDAIRSDAAALADLRQEMQKSRKLTHPNIIRIYDLYEAPGEAAFFSMEYIEGPTLHELKHQQLKGFFGWTYLRPLVKQLCEAMDYAHNEGVIHRDLKPANMMLDKKERLKLADFGIASVDEVAGRHALSGTLNYMSPQQLEGKPPQVSDDIYALGATLYELLCGQPPFFEGNIAQQVKNKAAQSLAERLAKLGLRGDVPPDVAAMIMACLSKDPEKRPHSARLVAEWIGLTGTVNQITIPPTAEPKAGAAKTAVPPPAPPTTDAIETEEIIPVPAPKKSSGLLAAISLIVFVLISIFFWHRSGKKSGEANPAEPAPETWSNNTAFNPMPVPLPAPVEPTVANAIESTNSSPESVLFVDTDFNSGTDKDTKAVVVQSDGKIVIGGMFTEVNGEAHRAFARLRPDGSLDGAMPSFDGDIFALALQPDGKILAGGEFSTVNGVTRKTLVRLNRDLSVDLSFNPGEGGNKEIRTLLFDHGKIFAAGTFWRFNGGKAPHVVLLDITGHIDPSFSSADGVDKKIWGSALQSDGLILIGGEFKKFGAVRQEHLARINALGKLDPYFTSRIDGLIYVVAVQADRRIIIGGVFNKVNSVRHKALARLNPDGSLDASFDPIMAGNPPAAVQAIALQPDGKIIIGGVFNTVDGTEQGRLARLNRNGTLDRSFVPKISGAVVRSVAVQRNGKIMASGSFQTVDEADHRNVVELNGK